MSDDLATAQANKKNQLNGSCYLAINGGFASSALGTTNTYPSSEQQIDAANTGGTRDQSNLTQAAALAQTGTGSSLWCKDSDNNWNLTAHTALQVLQVMADFITGRLVYQAHLADLKTQVMAATTIDEVNAINW